MARHFAIPISVAVAADSRTQDRIGGGFWQLAQSRSNLSLFMVAVDTRRVIDRPFFVIFAAMSIIFLRTVEA